MKKLAIFNEFKHGVVAADMCMLRYVVMERFFDSLKYN